MKHARKLFQVRYADQVIQMWRGPGRSYHGAIDGHICASGPAKGEVMRRLIDMARNYPKAPEAARVAALGKPR